MRRGDFSKWPPLWTQWTRGGMKTIKGEVGVLRYVRSTEQLSEKCFLVIEYEREHYVGALLFDDSVSYSQVCALLQQHLGRSIKEIGDLEVSFTPE